MIASTATAVPEHVITRDDVKLYFDRVFPIDEYRVRAMMSVVDNSRIDRRYGVFPLEYLVAPRPLTVTTLEYQDHAIRLGQQAAEAALANAGIGPRDVDLLITTSCTGFMIPSLDAHLIHRMGFRSNVRRLPITELGCAAGAASLARAAELLGALPEGNVLLISVELPSLTFQRADQSQANLISAILFGDGAAGVVVTGRDVPGPRILSSEGYVFPDSLGAMGFDLKDSGFHIVLSADVPDMIRQRIRGIVDGFLESHQLSRDRIASFILHPGGQKLLSYVEEELGLVPPDDGTGVFRRPKSKPSWDVLANFGNLSSASVLFVLDQWIRCSRPAPGAYGLLAAFGPGFSAEMSLLEW